MNAVRNRRRPTLISLVAMISALAAGALASSVGAQATGSADLGVSSADSADPVETGSAFAYEISIDNAGPDIATAAALENKLPKGVGFAGATASQGSCDQSGRNLRCELGDLLPDPDGPATVTIQLTAPSKAGTITNVASASSETPDPAPTNNSASETTTVSAAQTPKCRGTEATIVGTEGSDLLRGTGGRDVIVAGRGADTIRAKGGNDIVCGGGGGDKLRGADGGDRLIGGNGRDRISGHGGNDELRGGRKADRLRGGSGNDELKGGKGRDRCNGGAGKDVKRSC